ncbi:hypothetical protein HK096_010538 [Nowakowskiella sp. JEL0078]|nr:hypothetical protein HK096_010538 [Nowakowskiella sp. JEL0078]
MDEVLPNEILHKIWTFILPVKFSETNTTGAKDAFTTSSCNRRMRVSFLDYLAFHIHGHFIKSETIVKTPVEYLIIFNLLNNTYDRHNFYRPSLKTLRLRLPFIYYRDKSTRIYPLSTISDTSLEILDISENSITAQGGVYLAKSLEFNCTIRELYLQGNKLNREGSTAVFHAIEKNNKSVLELLDISCNEIGDRGALAVESFLEEPNITLLIEAMTISSNLQHKIKRTSLTQLNLGFNVITHIGTQAIARALETNKSLVYLSLAGNYMNVTGAEAISRALKNNNTLKKLDLSSNNINCEGASAIANALKSNTVLVTLVLDENNIMTDGLKALATALPFNSTLEELFLWHNYFSKIAWSYFVDSFKIGCSLKLLSVVETGVYEEDLNILSFVTNTIIEI